MLGRGNHYLLLLDDAVIFGHVEVDSHFFGKLVGIYLVGLLLPDNKPNIVFNLLHLSKLLFADSLSGEVHQQELEEVDFQKSEEFFGL